MEVMMDLHPNSHKYEYIIAYFIFFVCQFYFNDNNPNLAIVEMTVFWPVYTTALLATEDRSRINAIDTQSTKALLNYCFQRGILHAAAIFLIYHSIFPDTASSLVSQYGEYLAIAVCVSLLTFLLIRLTEVRS